MKSTFLAKHWRLVVVVGIVVLLLSLGPIYLFELLPKHGVLTTR